MNFVDLFSWLIPAPILVQTHLTRNSWLGVDVIEAVKQCDFIGIICLIVLCLFSIVSWAIIAYKFLHIRQALKQTRRFTELCAKSGKLDDAFRHAASFPDSPLARIARETFLEIQTENWFKSAAVGGISNRLEVAKVSLERVHERTISQEISHLESWLIFLATTSSVCPFIGLLGTVWGILGVFQALAFHSSASLQVIAPGLATALTATVAGLVAAIPAVVSYNYFTHCIQSLLGRMDAFALEISNIVQKQILGG